MFVYLVRGGTVYTHRVLLWPNSRKRYIRERRFHVILGVTITLGDVYLVRAL